MQEMGSECNSHAVRHMKMHVSTPIVDAYWTDHCTLQVHRISTRVAGATGLAVSNPSLKKSGLLLQGYSNHTPKKLIYVNLVAYITIHPLWLVNDC